MLHLSTNLTQVFRNGSPIVQTASANDHAMGTKMFYSGLHVGAKQYCKPSSAVGLEDKEGITKAMSLHFLIFKAKAELDQLKDGLRTLGAAGAIQAMPDTFLPLFTADLTEGAMLTPGI